MNILIHKKPDPDLIIYKYIGRAVVILNVGLHSLPFLDIDE